MQLLWDNKILTATLARSGESPSYPIANVQDTRLVKVFRTLDSTDEYVQATGPITASRCAIMGHNLSETATIKIQGNSTTDFTAPDFEEVVTWKSGIIIHKFTEQTHNYWRFFFSDDDSGTDGYIEIGGLFLGTYLQLPNMKIDQQIRDETTSSNTISFSGSSFGDEGYDFRAPTVNFPSITDSERSDIRTMFATVKNVWPIICVVWANREDIETPLYCVIDQNNLNFKRSDNFNVPWSIILKFREVF